MLSIREGHEFGRRLRMYLQQVLRHPPAGELGSVYEVLSRL